MKEFTEIQRKCLRYLFIIQSFPLCRHDRDNIRNTVYRFLFQGHIDSWNKDYVKWMLRRCGMYKEVRVISECVFVYGKSSTYIFNNKDGYGLL